MTIQEFFQTYYVAPIIHAETVPYNIYNTITYGIILAVMVFLVYKLMKRMKVPIDRNFFIGFLPFILLASVLRVIEDAHAVSPWLVSPPIYIFDFVLALAALSFSLLIAKKFKIEYYKPLFLIGIIVVLFFASKLSFKYAAPFFQIGGLAVFLTSLIYLFGKLSKWNVFTPMNLFILGGAMFDASSTIIGMALYGYGEKHVLPSLLISYTNPWIMFPLKLIVVLLALWVIDSSEIDGFFKNFLKFAILTITLGPGARNTIRLMVGV